MWTILSAPSGKEHGRVVEDQLIICTIWSRGKRYHFIFRNERTRARTCTHPLWGSNTISEYPLCLPIHLPLHTPDSHVFPCAHTSHNTASNIHTETKSFSWSLDLLFSTTCRIIWQNQTPTGKDRCCVVTLTNSSCDSSGCTISMHVTHLTLTQWISILLLSLCAFTSFMCMWKMYVFLYEHSRRCTWQQD